MIVPRTRLLFWTAVIVLPFGLLAGVEPAAAPVSLVFIGLIFLVVAADAFGATRAIAGISVQLPDVVRTSKDRRANVEIRICNEHQREKYLRVAPALPEEIQSAQEELEVILPAGSEWSRFTWSCLPLKRGRYHIHSVYVEGRSPFGFWSIRQARPVKSEFRVYPNLLTERRNLAALFLHRGAFGVHAQRQIGKGRDFEKLREYLPGDSFDEIHWKATARRGRPVTKIFQIERTQEVYVVVDASRLSARVPERPKSSVENRETDAARQPSTFDPGLSTSILERYVTAALVLGLAAEQQGDLFGLLTFSDKVEKFVRARNGQAHYSACRDALYTLQPQIVSPDFDELCTFIRLRLRRRALLVFLTSLDDPALAESFVRNVDLVCRQHLVLVNMLQPRGATPLFTTPNVASLDDLYLHLGGHLQWQKLRQLEKTLQRRGVHFSLLQNERLSADLVSQYLSVKQRQLI